MKSVSLIFLVVVAALALYSGVNAQTTASGDPITCLVDKSLSSCSSTNSSLTCGSINQCLLFAPNTPTIFIKVPYGTYGDRECPKTIPSTVTTTNIDISQDIVNYNPSFSCDGPFLSIPSSNSAIKISINGINIKGLSSNSSCITVVSSNHTSQLSISSSQIYDFKSENGAAIYSIGFNVFVGSSSLFNNAALHFGGAIYAPGSNVELYQSNLYGNSARIGGALSASVITGSGSTFDDNSADALGGAIYIGETNEINVKQFSFTNNQALDGGAVYYHNGNQLVLKESTFISNIASTGGAIYSSNLFSTVFNFELSVFSGNQAYDTSDLYFDQGTIIYGGSFLNPVSREYPSEMGSSFPSNAYDFSDNGYYNFVHTFGRPYCPDNYPITVYEDSTDYICYGINAQTCVNGDATVEKNGYISSCSCFQNFIGLDCSASYYGSSSDNGNDYHPKVLSYILAGLLGFISLLFFGLITIKNGVFGDPKPLPKPQPKSVN